MRITLASGTEAELARPEGKQPARGLVVIPDIGSIRPLFDDLCARLSAEQGWAVCAFDVWPAARDQNIEWRLEHVGDLVDRDVMDDAIAAADATGAEEVSVIGFCMGGMYTLEGRGDRAVLESGRVLRDDPRARSLAERHARRAARRACLARSLPDDGRHRDRRSVDAIGRRRRARGRWCRCRSLRRRRTRLRPRSQPSRAPRRRCGRRLVARAHAFSRPDRSKL